jgi:hypothetical protein
MHRVTVGREDGLKGIQRARPDIAEHDPERAEREHRHPRLGHGVASSARLRFGLVGRRLGSGGHRQTLSPDQRPTNALHAPPGLPYLPSNAGQQVFDTRLDAYRLSPWVSLGMCYIWATAALAAAAILLNRRDA